MTNGQHPLGEYSMKPKYAIKPSPGKGRGVFATEAISPGTMIMNDPIAFKIDKNPATDQADVEKALSRLNKTDRTRFLALHEGHRPYPSRAFRIYKANAFDIDGRGRICLNLSLVNHSCVPNAEYEPQKDSMELFAVKPIAKGEEIFITYNQHFAVQIREHRQICTRVYWGFVCDCQACTLPPPQQALSDARRRILDVMMRNLDGDNPVDPRFYEILGKLSPEQAEDPRVLRGIRTSKLRTPLTSEQRTVYSFLSAKLLEGEGLICERLAVMYTNAARGLMKQMGDIAERVIIVSMANLAIAWTEDGRRIQKRVRGKGHESTRELDKHWEALKPASVISIPLLFSDMIGDAYAFTMKTNVTAHEMPIKLLNKEQCKRVMRAAGLRLQEP